MFRTIFASGIVFALASVSMAGSVVIPAEFKDIIADAPLIVSGRVTDVRAETTPRLGVESIATIAVDQRLKGAVDGFVSVRIPGGRVGRYRTTMIGAPTLKQDDAGVFFLRRGEDGVWRPVGVAMGIVRVAVRPDGVPVVQTPVVLSEAMPAGPVPRGDRRRAPMPLSEFESLVRLIVAEQRAAETSR
jgi:hypothetical protein